MNLNLTREEFQHDLQTIVVSVVTEAKREIIHMVNEDLAATNRRIDNLSRRMNKGFKEMDQRFRQVDGRFEQIDRRFEKMSETATETNTKIDLTHKFLHVHIANPSAHSPSSGR